MGWAVKHFKSYMLDELAKEKMLLAEGKSGSNTLMSNLVRASEERPTSEGVPTLSVTKPQEPKPLTVDEILGNVFVFNFAGHDTTAISLAYSMLLLVAHPEVQGWISEELDYYVPDESATSWEYEATFPKLIRTLAVLVRIQFLPLSRFRIFYSSSDSFATFTARNSSSLQSSARSPKI